MINITKNYDEHFFDCLFETPQQRSLRQLAELEKQFILSETDMLDRLSKIVFHHSELAFWWEREYYKYKEHLQKVKQKCVKKEVHRG